jgi:hypothetical protein
MRHREGRKAPDMDVLARHYLQLGLRAHPDVARHVPNVDELPDMPMLKLMKLAKDMGVESNVQKEDGRPWLYTGAISCDGALPAVWAHLAAILGVRAFSICRPEARSY